MKKIYAILIALVSFFAVNAQTFSTPSNAPIRDNQRTYVPLSVSGLPSIMDSVFGLCSVSIDIVHTYDGDLDIWLINPSNDSTQLSNNHGGGGDNFTATVFSMSATTSITTGVAPFTGNILPEMSLNNLNNSSNPNGTWRLCVADEAPGDTGHVATLSINFCNNPPPNPPGPVGPCGIANGIGCHCPDGSQDCDLLPDMIASGDIITQQHTETPGLITLSNATPNIGWGPMEIHGSNACWCDTVSVPCSTTICPSGNPPTQQLLQRLYHKNGNTITYHDTLTHGTMSYHPSHGHIHVNNWAVFTLRKQDTTQASPLNWPIYAQGAKISFCLINLGDCTGDYGFCRDSLGNVITMANIPNSPFGVVSGCGVDQGIYTGNLDIYSESLPGMSMDLSNVCNGDYYIVTVTDPDDNFIETNNNNNWAIAPITLTQQHNYITTGFSTTAISGLSITVSNNNTDLTSFVWDFGDGYTDTVNNPASHTYAADGTYIVTLTQINPCGTQISNSVITVTGMEEQGNFAADILKAMPNPANGATTISYNMTENGNVQLEMFNLLGDRVALLENGNETIGWHTHDVDFNQLGLGAGTYFVKMNTKAHTSTLRVINIK